MEITDIRWTKNESTIFVFALMQLSTKDLSEVLKRSDVSTFDARIRTKIAECLLESAKAVNTHSVVVCRVWPKRQTNLLTWEAEAIMIRHFTEYTGD